MRFKVRYSRLGETQLIIVLMATNAKKGLNSAERGDNDDPSNQQENNDPETFGQDIDVVTSARGLFGYSKLHAAASSGQARLLKLHLSDNSNVHSKDVNGKTVDGGYTPLHLAASAGHKECVEELLNCHKTDMHVTDAFGRTPLETAEQNFKNDVAMLLRSHGKFIALQYYILQYGNYISIHQKSYTCSNEAVLYWVWVLIKIPY